MKNNEKITMTLVWEGPDRLDYVEKSVDYSVSYPGDPPSFQLNFKEMVPFLWKALMEERAKQVGQKREESA